MLPDILARVGNSPAFFFVDPFGTKDIAFNELLPIFRRQWTTEVLITLHTDGIAKKAGWFAHENAADSADREKARKLTEHLAVALDIPLTKLREGWRETGERGNTAAFEERALAYYLKRLRSNRTRFTFTKPFRVLYYRPDDPFRQTPVCFHLVFATQHEKGLFEMNDAMADALSTFYREVYSDSFFPTFEAEHEQQVGRVAVQRKIGAQFASKPFTIDDVKRHCMQETDCLLKGADYRKLILQMARTRDLQKLDVGTPSNTHTRFRLIKRL